MTGTRPAQQSISDLLAALSQRLDPLIAARLTGGTDNTDWTTILAELDRARDAAGTATHAPTCRASCACSPNASAASASPSTTDFDRSAPSPMSCTSCVTAGSTTIR